MSAHSLDVADPDLLFKGLRNCRAPQIVRRNIADAAEFRVAFDEVPNVAGRERLILAEPSLIRLGLKEKGIFTA